jgi:predicted AlkP superfamily phosphohydrolase/phosphomutase
MPAHSARTVVLGVDSLDLLLVERWAAQGLLPFFKSMLRDSSLVRLSAVSRVLQGALWPNLLTGRSPGHHGTFYLTQLTNGTYDLDHVGADHSLPDPYYGVLDRNGVRCAIVDIPNDLPASGFSGLQVVDWLTEFQFWQFATQPPDRRLDILKRHGSLNEVGGYGPTVDSIEGHKALRQRLERSVAMKGALASELLARTDLDHLFIVFAEAHKAGHFLWKYMDAAHPDHVRTDPYLRDALLGVYQLLDTQLAQLALQAQDDNLLIFSDHGMQANHRGDQFIEPILRRLGLNAAAPGASGSAPSNAPSARNRLRSLARAAVMQLAPDFMMRALRRKFGAAARVDWGRTRVFQLPTDRNSYLRVNLRGREPDGVVSPAEYSSVLASIETELRALINPQTGRLAVEEVFRVHEMYPGPRVEDLPDLAVLWSSDAPLSAVESPRLGRFDIRVREDRSGNHRSEGFILARGPDIRPGVHTQGDILQIPGTLLALHGVTVPPHYEMPPLHDMLMTAGGLPSALRAARVA